MSSSASVSTVLAKQALVLLLCLMLLAAALQASEGITRGGDLGIDVSPQSGIAMDLNGDLWQLPTAGGEARLLVDGEVPLARPRWSPGGTRILYQANSATGSELRITDLGTSDTRRIAQTGGHAQHAAWHPSGERIVYAAEKHDSGLDLWEVDLATGLEWRLTNDATDEMEPAWSPNGRHLAWIQRADDRFVLMLRRHGESPIALAESSSPLLAPAWRPDGSLLTFLRQSPEGLALEMAILSEPPLVRVIDESERYAPAPVAWLDRHTMFYAADGLLRSRGFEDRRSRLLHFRAQPKPIVRPEPVVVTPRKLEVIDPPAGRLVIRAGRVFDGIWQGYRHNLDLIIESGRVVAIEPRQEQEEGVVLDLPGATVIPGLIDARSAPLASPGEGAALLAYGVTTVATASDRLPFDVTALESEAVPGPRVVALAPSARPPDTISIADGGTPGLAALLQSRQARRLGHGLRPPRGSSAPSDFAAFAGRAVIGSEPNQLAPGLALHAELRALQAAGFSGEQALHAAGRNAARALGLENQVGTIAQGALADLVLVSGDPLADVSDALNIIAVVRNGRFFSLVRLLEEAGATHDVE